MLASLYRKRIGKEAMIFHEDLRPARAQTQTRSSPDAVVRGVDLVDREGLGRAATWPVQVTGTRRGAW